MPVRNLVLTHFPAKKDHPIVDDAREVQQSDIEILDLNAGSINLTQSVLDVLNGFLPFSLPCRYLRDIEQQAARQKDLVIQILELFVDFFYQLLRLDRLFQQRFEHGQQEVRLVESECPLRHL